MHVETIPTREVAGLPLGRSLVEHDPASRSYSVAEYMDATQTPSKSVRAWWRRDVFDQNTRGKWNGYTPESSCTFQAEAGMLVTSPLRKTYEVRKAIPNLLNPVYRFKGYLLAQDLDQWPGSEISAPRYLGSSGIAAAKAAKTLGCVPEGWSYRWSFSGTEELKQALQYTSLSAGTVWTTGMDRPDSKFRVSADGQERGGHQWCILDWNERMKYFVCVNSWGRGWGNKGRFFVPESVMAELLTRDGDVHCWLPPVKETS